MIRILPLVVISFILTGAFLSSCDSNPPNNGCDTCTSPCDTCNPCDTCPPCDTCDTTHIDKDSLAHAFEWTEYTIPDEANLTGCWVFSDNLIYVMGTYLYRWNGVKWEKEKVLIYPTQLEAAFPDYSFFCLSPTDMWMVKGIALHYYDGSADRLYPPAPGPKACWGISSNDMFFVGDSGYVSHYDGTNFVEFPQVTTKNLRKVWGTSHNNVWASGWNQQTGESVLLHFDGTSWVEEDLSKLGDIGPGSHGLISVWATDSSGHAITVASGSFVYRKTDNGAWYNDSGKVENDLPGGGYAGLNNIRGNSSTDFMVQGAAGFLSHWNGKTWKFYSQFFDWNNTSQDAIAVSFKGNTVCMVGTKNGGSWIVVGRRKP